MNEIVATKGVDFAAASRNRDPGAGLPQRFQRRLCLAFQIQHLQCIPNLELGIITAALLFLGRADRLAAGRINFIVQQIGA